MAIPLRPSCVIVNGGQIIYIGAIFKTFIKNVKVINTHSNIRLRRRPTVGQIARAIPHFIASGSTEGRLLK
jgi:hypothetical protein